MAEQKPRKTTARKPKTESQTAEYKGNTYEVLDQNENAVMLTDGIIHFWARRKDVKVG